MLRNFWIRNNGNTPSLLLFSKKKQCDSVVQTDLQTRHCSSLKKAIQKRETKTFHQPVLFFSEDMVDMVDLTKRMSPQSPFFSHQPYPVRHSNLSGYSSQMYASQIGVRVRRSGYIFSLKGFLHRKPTCYKNEFKITGTLRRLTCDNNEVKLKGKFDKG